jgi:hypothetical protein
MMAIEKKLKKLKIVLKLKTFLKSIKFDDKKLQKKFKHAIDFGLE